MEKYPTMLDANVLNVEKSEEFVYTFSDENLQCGCPLKCDCVASPSQSPSLFFCVLDARTPFFIYENKSKKGLLRSPIFWGRDTLRSKLSNTTRVQVTRMDMNALQSRLDDSECEM